MGLPCYICEHVALGTAGHDRRLCQLVDAFCSHIFIMCGDGNFTFQGLPGALKAEQGVCAGQSQL